MAAFLCQVWTPGPAELIVFMVVIIVVLGQVAILRCALRINTIVKLLTEIRDILKRN